MAPAHESLDPGHGKASQVEGGLVQNEQLPAGNGLAQVHLQRQALLHGHLHFRPEDHVATFAGLFGLVERYVGVAQELIRVRAGANGHPDTGVDRQRYIWHGAEPERFAKHFEHALGHDVGAGVERVPLHQDDELVATQAPDAVAWPDDRRQALSYRL